MGRLREQQGPQRGEARKGRTSEAENGRAKARKKKASKKGKERKDESPEGTAPEQETEERKFQRGKLQKEELARKGKVLPEAEAARRKPPRCEKALKEMRNLRERRSHRGESPKYLDNCTVN